MTKFKLNARIFGGLTILTVMIIIAIPILFAVVASDFSTEVQQNLIRPIPFEIKSGVGFLVVAGSTGIFLYFFTRKKKKTNN